MRRAESARDLERDLDRLPGRQSAATQPRAERLSLQELGDEIGNALVDAHVVDHEDVRMIQLPRHAGLVLEPAQAVGIGGEGRRKHLHGNVPPEPGIAGAIDFSHPSGAERRQDLVGSEEGSGRDRHVGCG